MTELKEHPDERLRKLRELQLCELEMLKKIKSICEENDLTYYLSGGTLLGAVRHKGFIPWDDDVDVAMPRPDYEKFVEIAKSEFSVPPYSLMNNETDRSHYYAYIKIHDDRVKVRVDARIKCQMETAWIDVFPLDVMPKKGICFFLRKYHILYRRTIYFLSCFDEIIDVKKKRLYIERIGVQLALKIHPERFIDNGKQIRKFNGVLMSYPFDKGQYMINMMGRYKFKSLMEKEIYGKRTELQFEGEYFRVPEQYDLYLRRIYGDYMTPPPENARNLHSTEIMGCTLGEDE